MGAKWMVEMAEYIANNLDFIAKGFWRVGISKALDNIERDDENLNGVSDRSTVASSKLMKKHP